MKLRRVVVIVALTLVLTTVAYNQPTQSDGAGRSGKRVQLDLMVLTPTACVGSDLKLRLEVTNVTKEAIELNRAFFWNNYRVYSSSEQSKDSEREFFFSHVWPRSTSEDIVILPPGKTYVSHTYWPSNADRNELEPGSYTLEINSYGDSATAKFVIQNCKSERGDSRKG